MGFWEPKMFFTGFTVYVFLKRIVISFQVHWVPPVGSATRHPGGPTAARSCVVGGATTPHA